MSELLRFVTRSSGVVALVLILAAVADGLVFSGRETGRRLRPAWWMDLHRGLGGYALIFTGLHLVTAFGADLGIGLAEIFVPGAATWSTGVFTWGVLAFYAIAVTVLSSWPKRFLRRRTWHLIHLLSIPAAVAAMVHAYQLGSDARAPWFVGALLVSVATVMYPVGLRLSGLLRRRRARASVATGSAPTPSPAQPVELEPVGRPGTVFESVNEPEEVMA